MADNTALVKTILYKSLAEGVYREAISRTSSFYYFLGKTLKWEDESIPQTPVDSYEYEREVRNEIITLKEIRPSDVAFVVKRINWATDVIYDMYDDQYSDQVIGIDVISGGKGYIELESISVVIEGGGGSGATAVVDKQVGGSIASVKLTNRGKGYTTEPTVRVVVPSNDDGTPSGATGAILRAVMGIAPSGAQKLEDANFYVVTDDYNVYKCLDNNKGARSTVKPSGTQLEPFTTPDGYVWKFMYNIPINLRNKFYTDEYIPVVSALSNHFYSNGTIDNIFITNKGTGYTYATISVDGDGYRESDPIYINGIAVSEENRGSGYTNPTIDFDPPVGVSSPFVNNSKVSLGQVIYTQPTYVNKVVSTEIGDNTRLIIPKETSLSGIYLNDSVVSGAKIVSGTRVVSIDENWSPTHNAIGISKPVTSKLTDESLTFTVFGSGGDYYEVVSGGTTTNFQPSHKYGTVLNGTSAMKYIGTKLVGEISTVNPKNITEIEIISGGSAHTTAPDVVIVDTSPVIGATVLQGGSGYPSDATITFSEPELEYARGGRTATGTLVIEDGVIIGVNIISTGAGYFGEPTVTITPDNLGGDIKAEILPLGTGAVATAAIGTSTVSSITKISGGTGYSGPTVTLIGGGSYTRQATASAIVSPDAPGSSYFKIDSINIIDAGAGYTSAPTVVIEDSTGSGAEFTAVISGSPVTSITVDPKQKGTGYNYPIVNFENSTGSTPQVIAHVETGVIDEITLFGSVREVEIVSSGSGYLYAPSITFTGGGGKNSVAKTKIYGDKVISTYVTNPGDGYTGTPTVTFGDLWEQGKEVFTNEQYSYSTNLYTVVQAGVFGAVKPVFTDNNTYMSSDPWQADTSVLAEIPSDGVLPPRPNTLYVEGLNGAPDRLYQVMNDGMTGGSTPTHTGTDSVLNGEVYLKYLGVPASFKRAGSVATGRVIMRYGAGYSVNPRAIISDPTATKAASVSFTTATSQAKISAITENGQIVYLVIDDAGVGYTRANLIVTGNAGAKGASLSADLSLGSISSQQANNEILTPAGTIDAIAVVSGGYGYGVATITIDGDGEGARASAVIDEFGRISKINIIDRGSNYTYANVRVVGNASGQGAVVRAIISPYGGHGKNCPDELFARSLMFYSNMSTDLNQGMPINNDYRQVGIIKNPRVYNGYERFQGSIGSACYSIQASVSQINFKRDDDLYIERIYEPSIKFVPSMDLVVGQTIFTADRIYNVTVSGRAGTDAPSHTVGSASNGLATLAYVGSTRFRKNYRIISITSSAVLVQSLDNDEPTANDTFIKAGAGNESINFTAIDVNDPTVDKYSGQLMYIDNKQGFTPSADETITLRTIIDFAPKAI